MSIKDITVGRNLKGQVVIVLPGYGDDGDDARVGLHPDDANAIADLIRDQVAALAPPGVINCDLSPIVGSPFTAMPPIGELEMANDDRTDKGDVVLGNPYPIFPGSIPYGSVQSKPPKGQGFVTWAADKPLGGE